MGIELGNLIAGDTLDRLVQVPGYSAADGWTLKYRLVPRVSGSAIEITSTADGDDHQVTVAKATTAAWTAGHYSWAAYVEDSTDSHSLLSGSLQIIADPRASSAPLDLRTAAQVALDDAEAAMASWTPTQRSYTIGGRSMTFSSSAEIVPILSYWKAKVQREQRAARIAAGLPDPRKTFVRLGRV